jgi:hypothetical protein
MGIFSDNYARYAEMGKSVIPCREKISAVKWRSFQERLPSEEEAEKWFQQFPDHNLALITGKLSGITVVDCDDATITLQELFEEFGDTPLVIGTPRGGQHLYYRYNGEKCATRLNGKSIDVRGEGGYVLLPPSTSADNKKAYQFKCGDILDLGNLPCSKLRVAPSIPLRKERQERSSSLPAGAILEGARNKFLFDEARKLGKMLQGSALHEAISRINHEHCYPPLDTEEVKGIYQQVMGYIEKGRLLVAGEQKFWCPKPLFEAFRQMKPDRFLVYADLRLRYWNPNLAPTIATIGLADRFRYSTVRIRRIMNDLERLGVLRCTHHGGKYRGDSKKYVWGTELTTE